MKLIYGFLLLFCLYAKAQPITVGDKCPPIILSNLINYNSTTAPLSEFYKKPLLLSFWSTTCEVSTDYLLHVDSLKKELGNSVEWLFVTSETEEKVRKALDKERMVNIHFPFYIKDTMLRKFFTHRTAPHVCWIDVNGEVKAITGHQEVTKENVLDFSKRRLKPQPVKAEIMDNDIYFSLTPLIINDYKVNKSKMIAYSFMSEYRSGVQSHLYAAIYNPDDGYIRIKGVNSRLFELYKTAYKQFNNGFHFSQFFQAKDSVYKKNFYSNPSYCYDLIIRDTSTERAYAFMRKDLDRYFSLTSNLEKRKTKVWVLKRSSYHDKLKAKDEAKRDTYEKDGRLIVKGGWLNLIIQYFNNTSRFERPIIDETGYKEKVDIEIPINTNDLEVINKALRKYDLVLKAGTKVMDVIIIKKNDD